MKTNIIEKTHLFLASLIITSFLLLLIPQPAAALSCLNPAEMIKNYATEETYAVALIEAGVVETKGDEHDQTVTVKEFYRGNLATVSSVTFTFDETWGYLCTGGPAEVGTEALYVLNEKQVVQVFAVDSELGQDLLAAIKPVEAPAEEVTEEVAQRKSLMERIVGLLRQIITLFGGEVKEVTTPEPEVEVVKSYIGMNTIEAAAYADSKDVLFRVVEIDGETQPTTRDYREGRINATVEDDLVVSYTVEGLETQPVEGPETDEELHASIIGMTIAEAQSYANTNSVDFRVGTIDGESQMLTMDYRIGRITASTEDGVVVSYTVE